MNNHTDASRMASLVDLEDDAEFEASTPTTSGNGSSAHPAPAATDTAVLLLGFDWGTNTSCLQAAFQGAKDLATSTTVPTVVGYARDGILDDLLPGNKRILFGAPALEHRLHVRLVSPLADGVVADPSASRDFVRHLRSQIDVPPSTELRAVIGVPANADAAARENARQAVAGVFHRVILIPEPFLAALGYRDESRVHSDSYVDPVKNSLFVDIGGGTSDVCLIQGYYPTGEDQVSLSFAGDKVDALLAAAIKETYPDSQLSTLKVREIKEEHAYVGATESRIQVDVMVGGRKRTLDLTDQIGAACNTLLKQVFEAVKTLIERASSDSVSELLQNIILTGGGSQIRNLDRELERLLVEDGFDQPKVRVVGEHYKEFVAKGAMKAARQARENQWQQLLG